MQVKDIMTRQPKCCTPTCTAQMSANLMREGGVGFLPVLEKHSCRLVGVVTDRDLCLAIVAEGRPASKVLVRECMTWNPLYCHCNDEVEKVLELMKSNGLRRLPVMDAREILEGVISIGDLIRYSGIDAHTIKAALSQICEPRMRGRTIGHAGLKEAG